MKKIGNKESFWPSYVDIVTTLFAIMVVLFAVSYSRFRVNEKKLRILADKYEEIKSIYDMVEKIDTNYFEFNKEYVKHIFKIQVTFQKGKFDIEHDLQYDLINKTKADALREKIYSAGLEIKNTIEKLQRSESTNQNIKYLVVIEGQASADGYHINDYFNNDGLSYQRSLELHKYWKKNGIDMSSMPKCELVISGSGEKGVPRDISSETNNQRFLIHIVPVIGNIKLDDKKQN